MGKKRLLIFAYYSFKDPVFQSAVLPYFANFPGKEHFEFILLTFEQEAFKLTETEKAHIQNKLKQHNILWYAKAWHSGRFKIFKKIYDLIAGIAWSVQLVKKHNVSAIYSEGFPGGVIAHYIGKLTKKPHIMHTFEPHTDYMVESSVWQESNWEARLLRKYEGVVAKGAYAIMTATQAMIDKWKSKTKAKFYRVPSCVDLDHFSFRNDERMRLREKYNITDSEIVFVYLGKLGGMYMDEELFDIFKVIYNQAGSVRFMILSTEPGEKIERLKQQSGIPHERFIIASLSREQVPGYLSAADIGICGIRPIPSRRYSSPIKNGEYWACGLPVIIPDGISDDYLFAEEYAIGWRLSALTADAYEQIVTRIFQEWNSEQQVMFRQEARDFVEKDRNVKVFQNLYNQVFSSI